MNRKFIIKTPYGDRMVYPGKDGPMCVFDDPVEAIEYAELAHGVSWAKLLRRGFDVALEEIPYIHAGERI